MHAKTLQIFYMLPNFTFSCVPTSHPALFNSGTSQGQGDQLQTLINGRNIIYNGRQAGGRVLSCLIVRYSLPVRLQKEHRTRKGGNKKLDLIPQKTQH